MESISIKSSKNQFIQLSSDEDDDEPIYQPFLRKNYLDVPKSSQPKRRTTSLSPIPGSPSISPTPSMRSEYSESSAPPSRDSNRSINPHAKQKHLDYCHEEGCEICEYLIKRKNSKMFLLRSDRIAFERNGFSQGRSKSVEAGRQKPFFAKKLAQLDAAMKIVAHKVNQNVWEEKYLEAEELQGVLIWLRDVNRKLKKMLENREKHVENDDFKAAQKSKDEYEEALKGAIDLSKIQHLLTPTEYNTLLGLKQQQS